MLSASFITGTILIVCGFLVKWMPDLIAGYNTMSKADKEKIDVENLSNVMKKCLITYVTIIIISGSILHLLDIKEDYKVLTIGILAILCVISLMIISQKHTKRD